MTDTDPTRSDENCIIYLPCTVGSLMTIATAPNPPIETQPLLLDIRNKTLVVTPKQFDRLCIDNPDLCLELTPDRFSTYAALQVPEIWRYDGQLLVIYKLVGSEYITRDRSSALP
jgi:hypothetical protein